MIFRDFAIREAEGVLLAHTLRLPERTLDKGSALTKADMELIVGAGISRVMGARLEAGDIGEDEAARAVAVALAGENLIVGEPSAGRCNLYAKRNGLAQIDPKRIEAINFCGGGITLATLPLDGEAVTRQAVASIKVIPFAVPDSLVAQCVVLAAGDAPAVAVRAYRPLRTALIQTIDQRIKTSILDSTTQATRQRLQASGSDIDLELRCRHQQADIGASLQQALASDCELVLICGATISSDLADVIPSAIVASGGVIDHFGMPVEPGNMLVLGHCGRRRVIVLPGCSRSPKLNGLDWVLNRLTAGLSIAPEAIMGMGVGGLIKGVSHRDRMQRLAELTGKTDNYQSLPAANSPEPAINSSQSVGNSSQSVGNSSRPVRFNRRAD